MTNRTRPHTVNTLVVEEREDGMWDGRRDATTNQESAHEMFPSSNTNKTTSFSQTQTLHENNCSQHSRLEFLISSSSIKGYNSGEPVQSPSGSAELSSTPRCDVYSGLASKHIL